MWVFAFLLLNLQSKLLRKTKTPITYLFKKTFPNNDKLMLQFYTDLVLGGQYPMTTYSKSWYKGAFVHDLQRYNEIKTQDNTQEL